LVVPNLKTATVACKKKYDKGKHPQELLQLIDPHKVASRAYHCKRLFETLQQKLKEFE